MLSVRLTPNASRAAVEGWRDAADGTQHLAVKVTAVPEKGKANAALEKLLAKALGVAKSNVSVIAGATARQKEVLVQGNSDDLIAALDRIAPERADG